MDDYKIDKDRPIEGVPIKAGRPAKYPWPVMAIGDSVYIEGYAEGKRALNAAAQYGKRNYSTEWREIYATGVKTVHMLGYKRFSGRQEDQGWRIWRIADEPIPEANLGAVETLPNGNTVRYIYDDIP